MNRRGIEKSKRSLSKVLIVALIVLSLSSIAGVAAYLISSDRAKNVFEIGEVSVDLFEPNWVEPTKVVPTEVIPKDPQVSNKGSYDAYIYTEVVVPYVKDVVVSEGNGIVRELGDAELFTYEVNTGWLEVGTPVIDEENGIVKHIYAYVGGNGDELQLLLSDETTNPVFDDITLINIIDGQGYEKTTKTVVVNCYAIQSENVGVSGEGEFVNPEDVWDVIRSQCGL